MLQLLDFLLVVYVLLGNPHSAKEKYSCLSPPHLLEQGFSRPHFALEALERGDSSDVEMLRVGSEHCFLNLFFPAILMRISDQVS